MSAAKQEAKGPRLYLVDASSYAFRAYHASSRQGLSNSRGLPTGATLVFTNMLLKLLREERPSHLVVVWDAPGKTFRHQLYPQYKATRKETPSELRLQIDYMRRIVEALNLPARELSGYEADDVIGTIARRAEDKGIETVIVSGDKDLTQLVSEKVTMLDTLKDARTDVAGVKERFGVGPDKVTEVLALWGDSSDNIPGVPKVGEKTAKELITQYGSLEEALAHAGEVKKKSVSENLRAYADQARLSRKLATVVTDLPLEFDWDELKPGRPDRQKLAELFTELEFTRLLNEFGEQKKEISRKGYHLLTAPAELAEFLDQARAAGRLSIDTETSSLDPVSARLVGISMAVKEGEAVYVPVAHTGDGADKQMGPDQARELIGPALADPAIKKIGQNLKFDFIVLTRAGYQVNNPAFDAMIASYLVNPRRRGHGLDELAREFLGHETIKYEEVCGKGRQQVPFAAVPVEDALRYSGEDADLALRLKGVFAPRLSELKLEELFEKIEMPLVPVLARMEMTGVKVEVERLAELSRSFEREIDQLKAKIFSAAGEEFNLDSPKQLGEVLFNKLHLPTGRKTKTKSGYSTSVEVLQKLAEEHELAGLILEYRSLAKLKSTYTDALPRLVNPATGRLHTSYNQTVTSTGRLSSSDPNLQNIPVRSGLGRSIREAFVGEGENLIVSADYSQIELRLMAHYSEEPALLEAFRGGEDIHARTAMEIFNVKPDELTPDMRRHAKVINFGILYGMSAHGLTKQLKVDHEEAKKYIDAYFQRYPRVREFTERVVAEAREKGYVSTIMGRRLPVPEIHSSNFITRQAAEREAVNAPLQGSAADIIKAAMIELDRALIERGFKSRMIMQVHDELVFEAVPDELEELKELAVKKMEGAAALKVALQVEVNSGKHWAEAH